MSRNARKPLREAASQGSGEILQEATTASGKTSQKATLWSIGDTRWEEAALGIGKTNRRVFTSGSKDKQIHWKDEEKPLPPAVSFPALSTSKANIVPAG